MRSTLFAVLAVLAVSLAVPGCGVNSYDTVEEAAFDIFDAFCVRGFECGDLEEDDIDECVNTLVDLTCDDQDCAAEPVASDSQIRDCIEALEALECGANDFPSDCDGVLESL